MKGCTGIEAPVDQQQLSETQRAVLDEEGDLWIIDDSTHQEIKLDVKAGARSIDSFIFMIIWAISMQMKKANN